MGHDDPTRWKRSEVLWRRSIDSVVVLPSGRDEPLSIRTPGPDIWDLLADPITVDELTDFLADVYAAERDVVLGDVCTLIERLADVGAIRPAPSGE